MEKRQTKAERQRQRNGERESEICRDQQRQRHREASLPFLEAAQFSHIILPRTHNVPILVMLGCSSSPILHPFPRQFWVCGGGGLSGVLLSSFPVLPSSPPPTGDQPHRPAGCPGWRLRGRERLPGSWPGLCFQTSLRRRHATGPRSWSS